MICGESFSSTGYGTHKSGPERVRIQIGSTRICALFGGSAVLRDVPGLFAARNAPVPPQAPRLEDVRLIDYDFARWGSAAERTDCPAVSAEP